MPTRRRVTLPLLLALIGVALLVGCIPVPVYFKREHPEAYIGSATSSKPLKVGHSTREDLPRLRMPLPPDSELSQGDALVYPYTVTTVVWFPCWGDSRQDRYLRLEFDDQNILRRYKVFASRNDASRPLKRR